MSQIKTLITFCIFIFIFFLPKGHSQSLLDTYLLSNNSNEDLTPNIEIYVDTEKRSSPPIDKLNNFKPLTNFRFDRDTCESLSCHIASIFEPYKDTKSYYWLHFKIKNPENVKSYHGLLSFGVLDSIVLYIDNQQQSVAGLLTKKSSRVGDSKDYDNKYTIPVQLNSGEEKEYFVRINNVLRFETEGLKVGLVEATTGFNRRANSLFLFLLLNGFFFGIVAFMFVFSIFQYLQRTSDLAVLEATPTLENQTFGYANIFNLKTTFRQVFHHRFFKYRDNAYLIYAIYLVATFLYYWWKFEKSNSAINGLYTTHPAIYYHFEIPLFILMTGLYAVFIGAFLDAKEKLPNFHRAVQLLITVSFSYLIINFFITLFWGLRIAAIIYFFFRIVLVIYSASIVYRVFKLKNGLAYYVLSGTYALLFFGMITLGMSTFLKEHYVGVWDLPLIPVLIGVIVELSFFSMGLGYKSNQVLIAKKNEELKALTSQLNPHFVSNSLIAIEDLVVNYKNEAAEKYLEYFGRLMSEILSTSTNLNQTVSLKQEIAMSQRYLELQKLRFSNFKFNIEIDENTPIHQIKVPSLILQPYLENAIEHGINYKENGSRQINLIIKNKGNQVECLVEDNGIGRKAAKNIAKNNGLKKRKGGLGMNISANRIKAFNQLHKKHLSIQIIDKKDEKEEAMGTCILLIIPIVKLEINQKIEKNVETHSYHY